MLVVWAGVLTVWGIVQPDPYADGWRLVLELLFTGRLLNISDGMVNGFSQTYLFVQSAPQDIIMLLIFYPWVIRAYHGARRRRLVSGAIDRLRKSAERNQHIVEPFGALGLWVFVFFPFWSTGSLVGGIVGYLMGLRTWVTFASVFTGHIISVISLIWFFDYMNEFLNPINEGLAKYMPWIILGVIVIAAVLMRSFKSADEE
jgi:uncharacterized membrane protein